MPAIQFDDSAKYFALFIGRITKHGVMIRGRRYYARIHYTMFFRARIARCLKCIILRPQILVQRLSFPERI